MADVKNYGGAATGGMNQRELVGTIKPIEMKGKNDEKIPGYSVNLQLNANDPKVQAAAEVNPKGGAELNLVNRSYEKDGRQVFGHNLIYTKDQGDALLKAAGPNVAASLDKDGKPTEYQTIALKADLVPTKIGGKNAGMAVNTAKPMGVSELSDFGSDANKAKEAMDHQYAFMKESSAKNKEMSAAAKAPEAEKGARSVPEAPGAEAAVQAETSGPEMG